MNKTTTNKTTGKPTTHKQQLQGILNGKVSARDFDHPQMSFCFKRFSVGQAQWLLWYAEAYAKEKNISTLIADYGWNALLQYYYLLNKAGVRLIHTGEESENAMSNMVRSGGEVNFYAWLAKDHLDELQPGHGFTCSESLQLQRQAERRTDIVSDSQSLHQCQVLHRYITRFYPKARQQANPIGDIENSFSVSGLTQAIRQWLQTKESINK